MMSFVTAQKNGLVRIEASGASATLMLTDKNARFLFLQVPGEHRRQGMGSELIKAAEKEAAAHGATSLSLAFADSDASITGFLRNNGYTTSEIGRIISINPVELLESQGVNKSMKICFKDVETVLFNDLMMYQWEEIQEFMNRSHYYLKQDDYERFDPMFSCAAYDKDKHLRAVLLATVEEGDISVDFLLGFSSKNPEYILCVCQTFARSLARELMKNKYDRILIYSCTDYVKQLLERLMDSKYQLYSLYNVLQAKKEITPGGDELERDLGSEERIWLWRDEAMEVSCQRNISEKSVWLSYRR